MSRDLEKYIDPSLVTKDSSDDKIEEPSAGADDGLFYECETREIVPFLPEDKEGILELGRKLPEIREFEPEAEEYGGVISESAAGRYNVFIDSQGTITIEAGGNVACCFLDPDDLENALPDNEFVKRICVNAKKMREFFLKHNKVSRKSK